MSQSEDVRRRTAERIAAMAERGLNHTLGFRVLESGNGRARVAMEVTAGVENVNGSLHGGAIASLIDHAGTVAIVTSDREGRSGVSTDLNVTFFAPAPGGTTVVADAQVLKNGKTLAFVTVDVRRQADDVLVAQGRMTKYQVV